MAGSNRTSTQTLELLSGLAENPYGYEFVQVLRLLEALNSDRPRLGESSRAVAEVVRLGQEPSLAFPASMISKFEPGSGGAKDRLDVLFLGLFGPNGPLPLHLTEYARQRDLQEGDKTFRRFVDLFHHRMLSLFYRAWANAQPCVQLDRPDDDRFFDYVGTLIGIGQPGARTTDAALDRSRLYFSGVCSMQNAPANGLESVVTEYLQIPTIVEEFVGEWLEIPENLRSLLGRSHLTGLLGENATAGAFAWSGQSKFRLVCGPMDIVDFKRLLPDRESLAGLVGLVRFYVGDALCWELNLLLRAEEVPGICLGETGNLGWTTWLGNRTSACDADEVRLHPAELVT